MSRLKVHLFGYPHLTVEEESVYFKSRKTLALAAYFLLESGSSQNSVVGKRIFPASFSMETLADMFWPKASRQQGGVYLRQALGEFSRAAGEGWLKKQGQSIVMNPQGDIWVDVHEFELILEAWKAGKFQPEKVNPSLMEAVMLYQGDFLDGFTVRDSPGFSEWQALQAERLRLHMVQILEVLVKLNIRQQDMEAALVYAKRWLDLDQLNESAHQAVMYSYLQSGQRKAAQHQYEHCRNILTKELGIEPAAETMALLEETRERPQTLAWPAYSRTDSVPAGTVTFLFTDIEGSTHLWETYPVGMRRAFRRHEEIIDQAMRRYGGFVYKMIGDAFQVAFSTAAAGLQAAVEAQRNLNLEPWGEVGQIKVRIALHSGVTEERGNDYVGPELNRIARILSSGYGDQILLSQPTYDLVQGYIPVGVKLLDLGEHKLKDLTHPEHIYQAAAPGLRDEFPPLKTLSSPGYRLPLMTTDFVGRVWELEQIEMLLSDPNCRLITLLGIGGSGKTRLAIQAARLSKNFQHNTCFVSLASIGSLEDIINTTAQSIQFKFQIQQNNLLTQEDFQTQLFQYLAEKRLLIILDNFEQLTDQAAFVSNLLKAAPQLKVIVTSRERLNLAEEWVMEVRGLSFPGDNNNERVLDYAAVQLFISRAQQNCSEKLIPQDYPAIIRISQLLEGLPLGIEMAAAWVKMLSCAEIAAEIERDLDFLSASWRGMPERQQTLRAVFEHSWRLLSDHERESFTRLAVFSAGFSRQAGQEIAGVSILQLTSLADKSFLRRQSDGRYDIHPVLQIYVREKLVQDIVLFTEVQRMHAVYFAEWLWQTAEQLKGPEQLSALKILRTEMRNIRSALEWLVQQQEYTRLENILPSLVLFITILDQRVIAKDLTRIILQLKRNVEESENHEPLLALVLAVLQYCLIHSFSPDGTSVYDQQNLTLISELPDSQTKAYILLLNCTDPTKMDAVRNLAMGQECLRIFNLLGDVWSIALAQLILGDINAFGGGDFVQARSYYESSVQIFSNRQDTWGLSLCYIGLTEVAGREGKWEEAAQFGHLALGFLKRLESFERISFLRTQLAEAAIKLDRIEEAKHHFTENLNFFSQLGDAQSVQFCQQRLDQLNRREQSDTSK